MAMLHDHSSRVTGAFATTSVISNTSFGIVSLSVGVGVCLSVGVGVSLFFGVGVSLSVWASLCLSVWTSVCWCGRLCLFVGVGVCLLMWVSLFYFLFFIYAVIDED